MPATEKPYSGQEQCRNDNDQWSGSSRCSAGAERLVRERAPEIFGRERGIPQGETSTAMLGTDIALKHQVAEARFRDLLAEAERQRSVNIALGARPRPRRAGISEARAAVATGLLRAGSRLMPEET